MGEINLGLKGWKPIYFKKYIFKNLKDFCYEIKYALQRFWKGYDDRYLIDFENMLCELIPEIVEWYRYNRVGSSYINGADDTNYIEKFDKMLGEILYLFKEADPEKSSKKPISVERKIRKSKLGSIFTGFTEKEIEEEHAFSEYTDQQRKNAFRMFADYVGFLWN